MASQSVTVDPPVRIRSVEDLWPGPTSQRNGNELAVVSVKRGEVQILRKLLELTIILRLYIYSAAVCRVGLVVVEPSEKRIPSPWLTGWVKVVAVLCKDQILVVQQENSLVLNAA